MMLLELYIFTMEDTHLSNKDEVVGWWWPIITKSNRTLIQCKLFINP